MASRGNHGKNLTICAIPDSMPRMGKTADGKPAGLDVAVIEQVARILGRPIEFHWCAVRMRLELSTGRPL